MKILIIDDDPASLKVLSLLMKRFGDITTASNGPAAQEIINNSFRALSFFDLFLIDIMMPEINGHDLLENIRFQEQKIHSNTPSKIVMVSALSDADNIMQAFENKCDSYLVKPVRKEKLFDELAKLGIREL